MNRGFESGLIKGTSKGLFEGIKKGLNTSFLNNRFNSIHPNNITDPKLRPVFWICGDDVSTIGTTVDKAFNQIEKMPNEIFANVNNVFTQNAGGSYRPALIKNSIGGRTVFDFSDTNIRYLISGQTTFPAFYANTSPSSTGTGGTFIFVVKRKLGGTYTIFDGRDNSTLSTPNDLLIEVDSAGRITFDYKGGVSGTVTSYTGTAGINLLNDWSILTVKFQLREDGGFIPSDSDGSPIAKRYYKPIDGIIGDPLQIYVNGRLLLKNITTNTFTNADFNNDSTYRMFDRDFAIGNKASTYATSGTQIGSVLFIPAYIPNALQVKLENFFRDYYNERF